MLMTKKNRKSFAKIASVAELPDLLNIQLQSFQEFLQPDVDPEKRENKGLQAVFNSIFPIVDSRENFILEFVAYYIEKPKYTVKECQERGGTYSVPLKAKLRLSIKDPDSGSEEISDTIEQVVYLGNIPVMTNRGTFIINGAERIVVSQLHRSPGVFFDEMKHPNGAKMYSARIIPLRGSWLEFLTDINDVMYVYIDRRKKFAVTTLLRALGYSSDLQLYQLFDMVEEIQLNDPKIEEYIGRTVLLDVIDYETGEIVLERGSVFDADALLRLRETNISSIKFLKQSGTLSPEVMNNTLSKDPSKSEEEALTLIYRQLRSGDPPDIETARALVDRLFFNPKRYDLGDVGRYRLNKKLGLKINPNITVLTRDDIIAITKYLIDLRNGKRSPDDIDHLGNRRIKTVGEQLAAQMSVGLSRMARTVKERMNLRENENLTPQDLINARTILSVINTFFGTSQLSQFMDQTNPLAEMTHKRRLSALGPGGLTRERAGFEVRDVHYTHYGRLCPIETPEGPNIGLISSLTTFARINELGFIETPYRKVVNGRVTNEIEYLSADDEEQLYIAQANAPIDDEGRFLEERVQVRRQGDFPLVSPNMVNYMDVSPTQMVSAAASLIPFLEHDDANRALMGSNMQRQAVPLLKPEAPLVGTGMEEKVARDSRALIICKHDGIVEKVSANEIVVRCTEDPNTSELDRQRLLDFDRDEFDRYELDKFVRTNQDTCINQIPCVKAGDRVKAGDVLADGCATQGGELALGKNVLVAFMPWRGYNFEDAIVISERIVQEDIFTSIHIEQFELQVRDTKRGEEELTREIPNISEEATKDLDENGIVRVGAEVKENDILVGKVTPKGETDPTPEEKLLKAIFGEKAGDVKDASLKAPPGLKGVVIDTKLFSRKKRDAKTKRQDKKKTEELEQWLTAEKQRIRRLRDSKLITVLDGQSSAGIRDIETGKVVIRAKAILKKEALAEIDFDRLDLTKPLVEDEERNKLISEILEKYYERLAALDEEYETRKFKITVGDELPPGIVQLAKVYVAKKRKLMVGDKMAGRHGNKGVVAKIVPVEDMPFMEDGTPVDVVLNPLGVPSRMNLGQIMETNLGWAAKMLGLSYASPVFDGASEEEIRKEMEKAGLPLSGKTILYDGQTGEPFDNPVTVGYIYMMKLSHLVEDKIHARSIGPYSLITQQPLGGKAQFGGQRFGEMEVWALEAYGAAHTLQEILTVKSDDVRGRSKVYEAIVKGDNLPEPGLPESFNVLIRELMGLGLDVELLDIKDGRP
ncbi:MAG: DNA-directed RNA polymerase subunit beta [candidate division KSB1 bacterium]|nr:DNA-directed RNA polymerase subunit beta [candidate division KSB1 bacterium]MDZ7334676.1 DNA-directed RNA polymerase subunit beta [candidate division KSB1 bacterium]MDZ7358509.1 DNA-directed RNA polymerase subunit beta [candidate division KSB1 bacterium]MDZ7402429.1 DNA-directed RNA polymerase subunit beta [candidate division KSB1 bacterium]